MSFDTRTSCTTELTGYVRTEIGVAIEHFLAVQKADRNSNLEGRTLKFDGIFEIYVIFDQYEFFFHEEMHIALQAGFGPLFQQRQPRNAIPVVYETSHPLSVL